MIFSLTTRWNASRHETGEAMLDEILALGFDHVELGYDLRGHLVPGVESRVRSGAVKVDSLHAYCPLPPVVPVPGPEPFTLASPDPRIRASALHYLENTVRFAAEIGARVVVTHAGNVDMSPLSPKLIELVAQGNQYSEEYDKVRMKLLLTREKAVGRQLEHLRAGIGKLLPLLESTRRIVALEILPSWEAIPTELEMEKLVTHFNSPWLRCWHDMGHGQIRENLGLTSHARWVNRLRPILAGLHIHDVLPPVTDHLMPPLGTMDFTLFREAAQGDIVRVLEPGPSATAEEIVTGLRLIREAWTTKENTAT
jgi:sugar phosphate isomerase/epimerase